jgi:hypothetical protein
MKEKKNHTKKNLGKDKKLLIEQLSGNENTYRVSLYQWKTDVKIG